MSSQTLLPNDCIMATTNDFYVSDYGSLVLTLDHYISDFVEKTLYFSLCETR